MQNSIAILLDGGHVLHHLPNLLNAEITAKHVEQLAQTLLQHPKSGGRSLYRVFFYHSPPYSGRHKNPLTEEEIDFEKVGTTPRNRKLFDQIELSEEFALRRGELKFHGWKLTDRAATALEPGYNLTAQDIEPNLRQKQVDMKIGLDIAWLAIKRIVDAILLVTGDADFVPAMKFARREGVKVLLFSFQSLVRDLKAHADLIIPREDISEVIKKLAAPRA
jgi:uncharacterized LabA/DUF88 family protein